jgi:hypothetical protein
MPALNSLVIYKIINHKMILKVEQIKQIVQDYFKDKPVKKVFLLYER